MGFIKQIADETKMLGLNAAIEAARAGTQAGDSGVVAEEIRKLSDDSRQTVVKIRDYTQRLMISSTRPHPYPRPQSVPVKNRRLLPRNECGIEEILALAMELDAISRIV